MRLRPCYEGVNLQCSTLTCSKIPAGIGTNLAVFVNVFGEPPSVLGTSEAKVQPGGFVNQFVSLSYEAPKIVSVTLQNTVCSGSCHGQSGDSPSSELKICPSTIRLPQLMKQK